VFKASLQGEDKCPKALKALSPNKKIKFDYNAYKVKNIIKGKHIVFQNNHEADCSVTNCYLALPSCHQK